MITSALFRTNAQLAKRRVHVGNEHETIKGRLFPTLNDYLFLLFFRTNARLLNDMDMQRKSGLAKCVCLTRHDQALLFRTNAPIANKRVTFPTLSRTL